MSAPVDPPETVVDPPVNPGPWASDLATYLGDNAEAIAAADRYMREKVQPRITELEEGSAAARELYKDLIANPESTLAEVVTELYGEERPDVVEGFTKLFEPAPEPTPRLTPPEPTAAPVAPEDAEMREWYQAKRDEEAREAQAAAYAELLQDMRTAHPDLDDTDMDLIHPFIASAQGDTEQAYAGYQAFQDQFKTKLGVTEPTPEPTPTAPAVLGTTAAAAAAPPVVEQYKTYDEAWDAWQAEKATTAPPVVGSA